MATYLTKILLLILLPVLLIAGENRLNKIYDEVLINYSNVNTYETSFVQENYWIEMDVAKTSKGKLFYDKDNLSLNYSEPDGQKLLISEKQLTMYDPNNEQAIITDEFDIELRPEKLISHYWDISEKNIIDEDDETIQIELKIPNGENVIFSFTNKLLTEVTIIDTNRNFVIYKFSNIQINQTLPKNIFELVLPEKTNIIDTRKN